jgi:hypothetical protein
MSSPSIISHLLGDACTTEGWNPTLRDCYTPVICPPPMMCEPTKGCYDPADECEDNRCATKSWDPINGCVYTDITCLPNQVCDPTQGCVCDDGDLCTSDFFNSRNQICTFTRVQCPLPTYSCDPGTGWEIIDLFYLSYSFSCHSFDVNNLTAKQSSRNCVEDEELVPCISVIDEDDNYRPGNDADDWNTFRTDWPLRPFCLLEPFPGQNNPSEAFLCYHPPCSSIWSQLSSSPCVSDVWLLHLCKQITMLKKKNTFHRIRSRDEGVLPADDWFNKCAHS